MTIHHDRFIALVTAPQGIAATMNLKLGNSEPTGYTYRGGVRMVAWRGRLQPLWHLCQERGLGYRTVTQRMDRGWSLDEALSTPVQGKFRGVIWRRV